MKELRFLFEIICFVSIFLWSIGLYRPYKWYILDNRTINNGVQFQS